ncbi:uncharacterized protein VICG_01093 [Vittaforma corneae ATCC 50505]|uniref:Ribonuclease P/MRP protein subunit POP5 n=1 Tax=Vittaforma corneae (strain ATCC 50505) TaxID=993615 RepID=L2GMP3_VITCO|nr:uncharacterized protein VICG_01093 [Vittaforma corneae ATCC 50505]ELA41909.1 hypothetical protein VICG_01093 [Vittaforma corneae ATCC 50505]
MAGFKHRYIVVKIDYRHTNRRESTHLDAALAQGIKNLLYNSIKTNFGEYVLGMIDCFEVVERYDCLGIVIIRCNLSIHKYVCYTICSMGKVSEAEVRFSILAVSGILRKAKKRLLEIENRLSANK